MRKPTFTGFLGALYAEWSTLVAGALSALAFLGSALVLLLARFGAIDPATGPVFVSSLVMWASGTIVLVWAAYRIWYRERLHSEGSAESLAYCIQHGIF